VKLWSFAWSPATPSSTHACREASIPTNLAISSDHCRRGHGRYRRRPAVSASPEHPCATWVSTRISQAP
jgi:hypothetical protein